MNKKLKIKLPIKAAELERILRTHCENHGVWDDCIVELDDTIEKNELDNGF